MRYGRLINSVFGPDVESPADDILIDAWDAETPAQMCKLARKALNADLNAIDAYNILGIHAETLAEKIAFFREGAAVGQSLFAPLIDAQDIAWWGFMGTRPWMRAQQNLCIALLDGGDLQGAEQAFRGLLVLNPNDNQGVRSLLLQIYAESGKYEECEKLFAAYSDDAHLEFPATRLLVALAKTRSNKGLEPILSDVSSSNRYLLPALKKAMQTNKWPRQSQSEFRTLGSKQEANDYLAQFKQAWLRKPKTVERVLSLLE